MADLPPSEVWPPPIWREPSPLLTPTRANRRIVRLIAGLDLVVGLLLCLDILVALHWSLGGTPSVFWPLSLCLFFPVCAPFFTLAWILPRLVLKARLQGKRNALELQIDLAWYLFWLTALFVALPALFVTDPAGRLLMGLAAAIHVLLIGVGFAGASYLRRVCRANR